MCFYLLTRFLTKPQDPRESYASCRKYEGMSNCLTQAAVTPDRISLVNSVTTIADILTCAIFFISSGDTTAVPQLSFTDVSKEVIGRERANRQQSSRLFELSPHGSTKTRQHPLTFQTFFCHHLSAPVRKERGARNAFKPFF